MARIEELCKKLPAGHIMAVLGTQLSEARKLQAQCEAEGIAIKAGDVGRMRDAAAFQRYLHHKLHTESTTALIETIFKSFLGTSTEKIDQRGKATQRAMESQILRRGDYKQFVIQVAGYEDLDDRGWVSECEAIGVADPLQGVVLSEFRNLYSGLGRDVKADYNRLFGTKV